MNLIFVMMDGARIDRITKGKNYQNLISKSVFFSKCIAYAPFTIAAMHAVFSGEYGTKTGVDSYFSSPRFKKDKFKTLTSYLHDNEYYTHADVINKLVIPKIGFDEFVVHDELNDDLTERHLGLINQMKKITDSGKNFFLYLHYSNIHTGIMNEVLKKYNNFSKEYYENKEKNELLYDKLFENADEYLGKIIEHCEELGLMENSLIVVISDHGISIGEKFGERAYGVFCYDYTLNGSSVFYQKSISPIYYQNQVRSIDILPTILDLLSISKDPSYNPIQGESLLPLFNGSSDSRIAFSQSGNPLNDERPPQKPNVWAIRTDKWKYIKNIHDGSEELYDLINDPKEEKNLVEKETQILNELRNEMEKNTFSGTIPN